MLCNAIGGCPSPPSPPSPSRISPPSPSPISNSTLHSANVPAIVGGVVGVCLWQLLSLLCSFMFSATNVQPHQQEEEDQVCVQPHQQEEEDQVCGFIHLSFSFFTPTSAYTHLNGCNCDLLVHPILLLATKWCNY